MRPSTPQLQLPKSVRALHFAFYRVPVALLSLTNCALEFYLFVSLWSGALEDFGALVFGLIVQFTAHHLGFLLGLLFVLTEVGSRFHSWLGFNPKLLLFPPFGAIFYALVPAILWLFPVPQHEVDAPGSSRDVIESAAPSLYWIRLWQEYNGYFNNGFLLMELVVSLLHLLVALFGLSFLASSKRGIESFEYHVVSFAVGIRIAYIIFMAMPKFALSSYFWAGLFKVCWFVHDTASNWYCLLICFNIGISVWATDPQTKSLSPGLPHAVGIQGESAERLATVFRWTLVAVLCFGFICDLVAVWRAVLGEPLKRREKVCWIMISPAAVLPFQLLRFLAPPIVTLNRDNFETNYFGAARLDAIALLFAFASLNPKARDVRMYFLLREELRDRVDAEQKLRRSADTANGRSTAGEGDPKEDEAQGTARPLEPPIPLPIALLNQMLSLRPFSRRKVRALNLKHKSDFLPRVAPSDSVSTWLRFFGHVGFTILGLFSTLLPFFFLPHPSDGLMTSLFVMKCVALLPTLALIPSARSLLHFQHELIPGWARLYSKTVDSRIEAYFRQIVVVAGVSSAIPVELLPREVAGRIGTFLSAAAVGLGPLNEVDFDQDFAFSLFELPPNGALHADGWHSPPLGNGCRAAVVHLSEGHERVRATEPIA